MTLCTLILLAIMAPAVGGRVDAVQEEMKRLEGTWVPVSIEADGETLQSTAPKVTISDGKWIEGSGKDSMTTVLKVNPLVVPKQFDLLEEGDETFPGIYKLEGDTLTVSQPYPLGDEKAVSIGQRPTRFVTRRGDNFVVTHYKRDKP